MKDENIEWSLYWAQDRLHSCVAADQDIDQRALNNIWEDFSSSLGDSFTVLDLATGNGAVPSALLAANASLKITGVDKAAIKPLDYLSVKGRLDLVEFLPGTDINKLPFSDNSFDAITSQYGLEYAGFDSAIMAVMSLLKPNGKFRFLVHHVDSEIVKSSRAKLEELAQLIRPAGLVDTLLAWLQGSKSMSELESQAQKFQSGSFPRTEQISGQVFTGINQVISQMPTNAKYANDLAATISLRTRAEHDRLAQMNQAAQSEESVSASVSELMSNGIMNAGYKAYYADDDSKQYLLGWVLNGEKK